MRKDIISEIDLLPNGRETSPAKTAWEAISNGLVNIQQAMKYREDEKVPDTRSIENGRRHVITIKDVEEIVNYIKLTINNCLSTTLPNLMLKESKVQKNRIKLNESALKQIIAESMRKVLNEGGISLSDYDNPLARYNRMDSDAPWEQDSIYDTSPNEPYYDADEECWDALLSLNRRGLISDDNLDKIRNILGY